MPACLLCCTQQPACTGERTPACSWPCSELIVSLLPRIWTGRYPIRDYKAPRTSYLAMLLVGIPVGTLLAGLSFIALRRWQQRINGPGPEYSRVANRGDGDL
jgi:hypothetical protein